MAQANNNQINVNEPSEVHRVRGAVQQISNQINAPLDRPVPAISTEQAPTSTEEPMPWQPKEYSCDQGLYYMGQFYPYSEYPEFAWSQIATHNAVIYPYIVCVGDWRARRSAMLTRLHFPMVRLNFYRMTEFDLEELGRIIERSLRMKGASPLLFMTFTHLEESFSLEVDFREGIPLLHSREMGSPEALAQSIFQSLLQRIEGMPDVHFVFVVPHTVHLLEYNKITKRTAPKVFQISPNPHDFGQELRNEMLKDRRNFTQFWSTFRSTFSNLRRGGNFKNFFTLPQIPFLRKKHYNASERFYFAFHFRRMHYNPSIWLLPDTLHPRDSSIQEVLSLTLYSFARFEERHRRPIHPELMMRLLHSGTLYGFSALPAPDTFNRFPPTFNSNQNRLSIQATAYSEPSAETNNTILEDNDIFIQSYTEIFRNLIPDFDEESPEAMQKVKDYERSRYLQNLSLSPFYKERSGRAKKKLPSKSNKSEAGKGVPGNPIPGPSGAKLSNKVGNSSKNMTPVIIPSASSSSPLFDPNMTYENLPSERTPITGELPIFRTIESREDEIEQLLHQYLDPVSPEESPMPEEDIGVVTSDNSQLYQTVDFQSIEFQVDTPKASSSTPNKETGAIPKKNHMMVDTELNTEEVEISPELIHKLIGEYNPVQCYEQGQPRRFDMSTGPSNRPPGRVTLHLDQIPSYLRLQLLQDPEQVILPGESGIGIPSDKVPEFRQLAKERRKTVYIRRQQLIKGVDIPKPVKRALRDKIKDCTIKLRRMGAELPPLFKSANAPQLSKLLITSHEREAIARLQEEREMVDSNPPTEELIPSVNPEGYLENISSEEEMETPSQDLVVPPPEPHAVEPTPSTISRELLENISSDEEL